MCRFIDGGGGIKQVAPTRFFCASSRRLTLRDGSAASTSAHPLAAHPLADVAPKREKRRFPALVDAIPKADVTREGDLPATPKAEAVMDSDEVKRQLDELAKLDPQRLEELLGKFTAAEEHEARVLQNDSLYQLDVSLKLQHQGGVKVFWKNVEVVPAPLPSGLNTWYHVAVDGRKVKAFETKANLVVPGEDFAYAIAAEWGKQGRFLNKLSMPLTDLASGAQHVSPQMIAPRLDYLMSFFANDNCFFRSDAIQCQQDGWLEPIADWYGRVFDFDVPRVVGIAHPHLPPAVYHRVREYLYHMNLNQYQVVALCVMAQCTASIMLPLALVHRVITLPVAVKIMHAEEAHNTLKEGVIEGYHDIRESDQIVKLAAAVNGYHFGSVVTAKQCSEAMLNAAVFGENDELSP